MKEQNRAFLIRIAYWLGIVADALWAVALWFPRVFAALTGTPYLEPDLQLRLMMSVAASLMTGWTFLLLWAVRDPIGRRFVILLTAFPVVFGLSIVTLVGVLDGNTAQIWILVKTTVLFVSMITSYVLADQVAKDRR